MLPPCRIQIRIGIKTLTLPSEELAYNVPLASIADPCRKRFHADSPDLTFLVVVADTDLAPCVPKQRNFKFYLQCRIANVATPADMMV
jgi:hypothetical protein